MNRNDKYIKLNTELSYLSNNKIEKMLERGNLNKKGWGTNHLIKIRETKVFVKKIPLTQVEFNNLFSTKNNFNLPTTYNYGIGSAGFGAFRELLMHVKTTNWVLNKECTSFPLMYHYRILKKTNDMENRDYKAYFKHWHNDSSIKNYVKARRSAPYEIALFLEHIPYNLYDFFIKDKKNAAKLAKESINTIQFLKSRKIIHMDMHFLNVLTDGKKTYITDFGLAIDKGFDLTKSEKIFFKRHNNYDFGEFIGCMGLQLSGEFDQLSNAKKKKSCKAYWI